MKKFLFTRGAYSLLLLMFLATVANWTSAEQKGSTGPIASQGAGTSFADIAPWVWVVSAIVLVFVITAFIKDSGSQIGPSPSQDMFVRHQKETEE